MKEKNFLVVNDDGIDARGIHTLVKSLSSVAKIYVCAPDRQRTASGHGITVADKIYLLEQPFEGAQKAYSCSGTPADCVKLGLHALQTQGIDIDMVCSGINHGANLGTDVLYSGTVAAALEGVICGIPSIAFSCCSHAAKHLEVFDEFAAQVCLAAWGRLSPKTVLNVNAPDLPLDQIKGLRYTTLGDREYQNIFQVEEDQRGGAHYTYSSEEVIYKGLSHDIDVMAYQEGYISITPLQYDLTNYRLVKEVSQWGISFGK